MNIKKIYSIYSKHFLVDTDTRRIRKNTIFFALSGANFNGNTFAEEAIEKGAIYSIVDDEKYKTRSNIILVDNVLKTLQDLALYHRLQLNIPIIGLTGSNGKTTTKELINTVLKEKYTTTATLGNLNNHIGVPLTLLSMDLKTEIGIVEMGANHPKEIEFLCSIIQPDYGYITNFGKAHLEGFGSLQGVIASKSELYDFLYKNNKTVFVNREDSVQMEKTTQMSRILVDDTIRLESVNPFVKLTFRGEKAQSNLVGRYNFSNIAIAITFGEYFKVPTSKIKKAIESYIPTNNRSQVIKKGSNQIILDAYNANPTSMKAALENFNLIEASCKTVILGDMFELGEASLKEHQYIVDFVAALNFKHVFYVGENFYKTTTTRPKFKIFSALNNHLEKLTFKDGFFLIKGSRGMALERVLEVLN